MRDSANRNENFDSLLSNKKKIDSKGLQTKKRRSFEIGAKSAKIVKNHKKKCGHMHKNTKYKNKQEKCNITHKNE